MQKPENWKELTWQEKREWRFKRWRAAEGVKFESAEAKKKHDARVDRIIKAIKLEELPDRVPIDIAAGSFPAYYAGYDLKTVMYDAEKMRESFMKFARDFQTDTMPMAMVSSARVLEYTQSYTMKWPGGGLPDDAALFQFVEKEYMQENEYDEYFRNPADYILRKFLPRTQGVFAPFSKLGPLDSFMGVGQQLISLVASPEFKQMAENLLKAHEASVAWGKVIGECIQACREMGYPATGGGGGLAPFDTVADMLRGTHGSVVDMFRHPQQILELCEQILPITLRTAIEGNEDAECPLLFIPMHKGDDVFMSDKQFEKFYWPTYRRMLIGLIEEGYVPQPVVDGTYNRRLEYIKDLPKSGVVWVFEKTDMALAKKALGGIACICGNVRGAMMATHTPDSIARYCRELIDTCAPGGGYILSLGSSIAGPINPDNVRAIIETGEKYGVYK